MATASNKRWWENAESPMHVCSHRCLQDRHLRQLWEKIQSVKLTRGGFFYPQVLSGDSCIDLKFELHDSWTSCNFYLRLKNVFIKAAYSCVWDMVHFESLKEASSIVNTKYRQRGGAQVR